MSRSCDDAVALDWFSLISERPGEILSKEHEFFCLIFSILQTPENAYSSNHKICRSGSRNYCFWASPGALSCDFSMLHRHGIARLLGSVLFDVRPKYKSSPKPWMVQKESKFILQVYTKVCHLLIKSLSQWCIKSIWKFLYLYLFKDEITDTKTQFGVGFNKNFFLLHFNCYSKENKLDFWC